VEFDKRDLAARNDALEALLLRWTERNFRVPQTSHSVLDTDIYRQGEAVAHTVHAARRLAGVGSLAQALALVRVGLEQALSDVLTMRYAEVFVYKGAATLEIAKRFVEANQLPEGNAQGIISIRIHEGCRSKPADAKACIEIRQHARIADESGEIATFAGARLAYLQAGAPAGPGPRVRKNFRPYWFMFGDEGDQLRQAQVFYEHQLSWKSLLSQLERLEWRSPAQLELWRVHLDYLSAYVHPHRDPRDLLDLGGARGDGTGANLAHWMIQLYANCVLCLEVQSLAAFESMRPELDDPNLQQAVSLAEQDLECTLQLLGLPGASRHPYDLYRDAVTDGYRQRDEAERFQDDRPIVDADILRRLEALASPQHDLMTGLTYRPGS
jgi:hypothetical protein